MKQPILAVLAVVSILANPAFAAADPSLHEVYQAVEAGRLRQAEGMMDRVLRDHPNSAKAHFVEAELLARQGRLPMARAELGTAERLAPGLPFAKAEAVAALHQRIDAASATLPAAAPALAAAPSGNFPWGPLLVGAALLAAAIFFVRSLRRPQALAAAGSAQAPAGGGLASGYPQAPSATGFAPPGPSAGGLGSGIVGGLAMGAAVGAGMFAGESLMRRLFGGSSSPSLVAAREEPVADFLPSDTNHDMGGNDFGISDASSWDDGSAAGGGDWS